MSITIRIDEAVEAHIREQGRFGETHNDVLRRLLVIGAREGSAQNGARKRHYLWGHSASQIIRWMGKEGWRKVDARKVLDSFGLDEVTDVTIYCQLNEGVKGAEKIAKLTGEQIKELNARRDTPVH